MPNSIIQLCLRYASFPYLYPTKYKKSFYKQYIFHRVLTGAAWIPSLRFGHLGTRSGSWAVLTFRQEEASGTISWLIYRFGAASRQSNGESGECLANAQTEWPRHRQRHRHRPGVGEGVGGDEAAAPAVKAVDALGAMAELQRLHFDLIWCAPTNVASLSVCQLPWLPWLPLLPLLPSCPVCQWHLSPSSRAAAVATHNRKICSGMLQYFASGAICAWIIPNVALQMICHNNNSNNNRGSSSNHKL